MDVAVKIVISIDCKHEHIFQTVKYVENILFENRGLDRGRSTYWNLW
jgi:hypothetical protein